MNALNQRPLNPLKIMLLDDHAIILHGMMTYLSREPGMMVVGGYTSSRQLFDALRYASADVIIADYALEPGDIDGSSLIRTLMLRNPATPVLMMSGNNNIVTLVKAIRAGARGFVSKTQDMQKIADAVRTVAKGQYHIDTNMAIGLARMPEMTELLDSTGTLPVQPVRREVTLADLSLQEQKVIRCFLEGMTVSDIAQQFSRSIKTISGQKQSAMRKLGLKADRELFILREQLQ